MLEDENNTYEALRALARTSTIPASEVEENITSAAELKVYAKNPRLQVAVALNRHANASLLSEMCDELLQRPPISKPPRVTALTEEEEVAACLVRNMNLPDEQRMLLLHKYDGRGMSLSKNLLFFLEKTPASETGVCKTFFEYIAENGSVDMRERIAESWRCPVDVLHVLACDDSPRVRKEAKRKLNLAKKFGAVWRAGKEK